MIRFLLADQTPQALCLVTMAQHVLETLLMQTCMTWFPPRMLSGSHRERGPSMDRRIRYLIRAHGFARCNTDLQ